MTDGAKELKALGWSEQLIHLLEENGILTADDFMRRKDLAGLMEQQSFSLLLECRKRRKELILLENPEFPAGEVNSAWLESEEGRSYCSAYYEQAAAVTAAPVFPSLRIRKLLEEAGVESLSELILLHLDDLFVIPGMDFLMALDIDAFIHERMAECERNGFNVFHALNPESVSVMSLPLSGRSRNQLINKGYDTLAKVLTLSEEEIPSLSNIGKKSAQEITALIRSWKESHALAGETSREPDVFQYLNDEEYREKILAYARVNDRSIDALRLSARPKNRLIRSGYRQISEILFLSRGDFLALGSIGQGSVTEIETAVAEYLREHAGGIVSFCRGEAGLYSEEHIINHILHLFDDKGFEGLSVAEIQSLLSPGECESVQALLHVLGTLVQEGKLEYTDQLLYRVYPSFGTYLRTYEAQDPRNLSILKQSFAGNTLESIGREYGVSRERTRQIIAKTFQKICALARQENGTSLFDEEYYRYFWKTYSIDPEIAETWFGIPRETWRYLHLAGAKAGSCPIREAANDPELDCGLRIRIRSYLRKDEVVIDGVRLSRRRAAIEDYVLRNYCKDELSFEEFVQLYNKLLEENGIPFSKDLYITDSVSMTRMNRISIAENVLWKQFSRLRWYDMTGRDFTELLEELELDAYEDVEFSAKKLIDCHPEIMRKYDIRDQYELHNLLRKKVREGSYHNLKFGRMPNLVFGNGNRDQEIYELMANNAPISAADLTALICEEYGFERNTVMANYLKPLDSYCHNGMYRVEQIIMPKERMEDLSAVLKDDFYFFPEIQKIFSERYPDADPREVSAYNLKQMGFTVLSRYALRNHPSLEGYFRYLLTKEESLDITPYRKRFQSVVAFSSTCLEMRKAWEIVEVEPGHIISGSLLEKYGLTPETVTAFCQQVYDYVKEGECFSITSIRKAGFSSPLFASGFNDWFYASLLIGDDRFVSGYFFHNRIFRKGEKEVTLGGFVYELVEEAGSMNMRTLLSLLQDTYGCVIRDRLDLIYKTAGSGVVYDRYSERFSIRKDQETEAEQ